MVRVLASMPLCHSNALRPLGDACTIADPAVVTTLAELLKTDASVLTKALTTRVVAANGEIYETKLVPDSSASPYPSLTLLLDMHASSCGPRCHGQGPV